MSTHDRPEDTKAAGMSRRQFVTTMAGAGAGLMIVPRHVLGRGFQAPSDLVNVAVVGIHGMGAENARAVMSQNIVAICDCDFGLLDGKLAQWTRQAQAPPRTATQAPPRRTAAKPVQDLGTVEGAARRQREVAGAGRRRQPAQLRREANSTPDEVPRLPRDAREAEGSRRDHRRDAGSHARGHCLERDGCRQARLRPEAAVLVGSRSAAPAEEGGREEEPRHADGQPASLERRGTPRRRVHHGRAPSARSAKCTCGRTGRSGSGRRGSRGRRR